MLLAIMCAMICANRAAAQPTFTTVYNFNGGADGAFPIGGLTLGSDGVLYGTTSGGGTSYTYGCGVPSLGGCGTVFSLTPPAAAGGAWTETQLYVFGLCGIDVGIPFSNVVFGPGGVLYGTAAYCGPGGAGGAYSLTPPASGTGLWTESLLANFDVTNGSFPIAGVVLGGGGTLYGATWEGGSAIGGTVYSVAPPASPGGPWTEAIIENFGGTAGDSPIGGLLLRKGVLYGTLALSGPGNAGTVFALTPPTSPGASWTQTTLYNFAGGTDGNDPYNALVADDAGVLYGTTVFGGTSGKGTVYSLTPPASPGGTWTEAVLYSFAGGADDGQYPNAGVVIGKGGVLFGATTDGGNLPCANRCGALFSLTPPASPGESWTETVLHKFTHADGFDPRGNLVLAPNGALYGTTYLGGSCKLEHGCGSVFELMP
jgi:uncharacterized repeat protein (TIGR03803 family)